MDDITEKMVQQWAKHRDEGRRKGIDRRHEWQTPPEWANREADEWLALDSAWRLLIGSRLAELAIELAESSPATVDEAEWHDCEYDDPSMCAWPGHRRSGGAR